MSSKIGLVFPGQGSQFVGMGKELLAVSPHAKDIFHRADKALGFSLSQVILEGPEESLKQTDIAQPAILTASMAAYTALTDSWQADPAGIVCAGHSLGEYSALCAAGAIDFDACVRLVRRRGQLMQEAAKQSSGGMAAVIGKSENEIRELCQDADASGNVQIANLNCPGQIVISGSKEALEAFYAIAREKNVRVLPLAVSGPFHSRFMQPAADELAADLDATVFQDARYPVIVNISAEPITSAVKIKESLLKQVTGSVRWEQSMQKMQALGVNRMLEIGPGKVLKGLMKKINPNIPVSNAFLPEEVQMVASQAMGSSLAEMR